MTEEEFALLAAGAALGALSAEDERAYRQAFVEHPEWAARADVDVDTATALGELADEVPPPPALRDRILERLDAPPAPPATPRSAPRRWGRRGWFVLAASLVLVAGIGTAAVVAVEQATRPAAVVALDRIETSPDAQKATGDVSGGGRATLHWSVTAGEAVLVAGELPPLTTDQTFELWYVRDGKPIAAGTFTASGAVTATRLDPGMHPGDVIAVTVEQSGGSPSGAPTTEPILAIPTS